MILFISCIYFQGAGTNDSTLIRVIISRCEIDMKQIKQEFQKMYGKSLEDMIRVSVFLFDFFLIVQLNF